MKYRSFGRSGVTVSEIGFGAWAIGGAVYGMKAYGKTDDATSIAALKRAVDVGITFVDTADVYGLGHSEELIRESGIRDKVILATKIGYDWDAWPFKSDWTGMHLRKAFEHSLKRLGTDHLDLIQLHNPGVENLDAIETLVALRDEGKARLIGVSVRTTGEAHEAIERLVDSIQLPYSYVEPEHRTRTFSAAATSGVAIIVREPLSRGLLSGKFTAASTFSDTDVRSNWSAPELARRINIVEEFRSLVKPGLSMARAALKFVLSAPEVSVVIPGIKTPNQAEENAGASDGAYALVGDIFESEDIQSGFGGDA